MINDRSLLDYIKIKINVSTIELSKEFGVSESSIRRALTRLEDKKLIKRYHGGAHYINTSGNQDGVEFRKEKNWKQKQKIAEKASKIISDNSTIILLGGTTVCAMCHFIKNKKLTVITNSLIVLEELKQEKNIKIILLGGVYNSKESELGGTLTHSGMKHIRADYLFSGAMYFDEKQGATTEDIESVELYRACIASSNQVYILADSSKFKGSGTAVTAYYDEINVLITDFGIDEQIKKRLIHKGLNIDVVDEK